MTIDNKISEETTQLTVLQLHDFLDGEKLSDIRYYEAPANWITGAFVCTATSLRHIDAVVDKLRRFRINDERMVVDSDARSEWVIASANGYIVHLFTQEMRDYYTLEQLWEQTKNESQEG